MWSLMLLFVSGAFCSRWKVEYQQGHICAVKGLSVIFPCSFSYPDDQRVTRVMWAHERSNIYDGPFIFDSFVNDTSLRFKYIGNKQYDCSFKIHQVEHNDAGKYAFRFITDEDKYTGKDGSTLKVADLNVSVTEPNVEGTTKEGDSVNLTCINGCDGGHISSALTWFKNREPINEGPVLYLSNVSSTNSGNYTCSLNAHAGTTSAVINIDVEYAPKNTSVSVRPSMEVDAGSNVTLICSSDANPPVENYTWFKMDDDYFMEVGHQRVVFSAEEGQYLCSASNKHGSQNSSVVTVTIKDRATFNGYVLLITTVAVLLIVTAVAAVSRLNKKRTSAPETDCGEDIQDTVYVNWPVFDNNQSQKRNQCDGATEELNYATLDFHSQSSSNMEQQMDSHHADESVVYSTVCRKQL